MKKKNLIVLLLLPFLIATLCVVTVNVTYTSVAVDILSIEWNYEDNEPFKLSQTDYKLSAVGKNYSYTLAEGNELVWTAKNKDGSQQPYGEIVFKDNNYYLKTNAVGEVEVTCSNKKGNVSRKMTAIIYDKGVIMAGSKVGSSQNNIDSTHYYGEYDLEKGAKQKASIEMKITTIPRDMELSYEASDNIVFDKDNGVINVLSPGKASLKIKSNRELAPDREYNFTIVEDGVNVYSYDDLLNCTNRSENGEIVVLQKHFESFDNCYIKVGNGLVKKNENTECFGNYNSKTQKYSFNNEVYKFTTTYNKNYIDQWNEFASQNKDFKDITDKVTAGIRVQKDFYGNGYTINLHNLTYPYLTITGQNGQSIPTLSPDNLFRGQLPFYTLGDPNDTPLISALGQDNVGMYIDGDNITVNDVNIKNCDFGDRVANLNTVGSVVDVHGKDVTIKNSRLSNGKNVLRAFSSENLLVDNCLLSNARNFLFTTGANEYIPVNGSESYSLIGKDGKEVTAVLDDFIKPESGEGDAILNEYLLNDYSASGQKREIMRNILLSLQNALNGYNQVKGDFKGSTTIKDTMFYKSGISSIALESLFNGPFLYNSSPSLISKAFSLISGEGKPLVPYTPLNVSGVSYPVKVDVTGKTKFYDYKTRTGLDIEGLIDENISDIANEILGDDQLSISIDDIFPIKSLVLQQAGIQGCIHSDKGEGYVNIPVAWYGGGLNLSEVSFEGIENKRYYGMDTPVDILDVYLNLKGGSGKLEFATIKNLMLKTVTTVTGYQPFVFKFVRSGYLYGETPEISQLVDNAKGV